MSAINLERNKRKYMALSYVEYSGNGGTSNFIVPFAYLSRTHVHVYLSLVETLAFTWVNASTIQITPAPPVGTLNVKILRTTPKNASLVDYINGSALHDTDLDVGHLQNLFIAQEYFEQAESAFPSGHTIDSHSDATPGESVAKGALRVYDYQSKLRAIVPPGDGGVLIGDIVEDNGARWLAKGTDGQVLEVDDAALGKLAWKQSLRKLLTTAGDLIYATGSGVAARLGIGAAGTVLVAGASAPAWTDITPLQFLTGDVKLTLRTAADTGWILMNDLSIGSASSGATGRANADTAALYAIIWGSVTDQWAPVAGGRGANAAEDFAANKALTLPKTLGRALAGYGTGTVVASGVDADVDLTANDLTVASNNIKWITGMPVVFTLASGTITGLTTATTYYVVRSSATKVKLASTLANAQNGTTIDLTAKSSPVWTITHTYTARVLGESGGEQEHAQSISQLIAHGHTYGPSKLGGFGFTGGGSNNDANSTTGSTGGNEAMNSMQPTTFLNVMVKL
jgi:hypothetical protein